MLVVEKRAEDIYFYDLENEDSFNATIKSTVYNEHTLFHIEITVKAREHTKTDEPYKVLRYNAPNLLEAGRLILAEHILYSALFEGEAIGYVSATQWLDYLDGGNRTLVYYDDDDDDGYDDDDYFFDDDDGDGGGVQEDIILYSRN